MKVYKNALFLLFIAALTVTLVACGGKDKVENKEKDITMSDILNEKGSREIILTEETDNTNSPQVKWAGTIGNGKMEIHPYANKSDLEFNDLKNLDSKEYKRKLNTQDKDYEEYGENEELNIHPRNTDLLIGYDNEDKIKGIMFDTQLLGNKADKNLIKNYIFSNIKNSNDDEWLKIQTPKATDISDQEITPYVLNIKKKDKAEKLSFENKKEYQDKYKNVRFINID